MKHRALAFLLIPLACAAACARATALTALPPAQQYRFVPPESLTFGSGMDDDATRPGVSELRRRFSAQVGEGQWVESGDSAQYDVAIFVKARQRPQRGSHWVTVATTSSVPRCDQISLQTSTPEPCTTDPALTHIELEQESWSLEYETNQVIRRRSDGAVRLWRVRGVAGAGVRARLAKDVRRMLEAGDAR